MGKPAIRVIFVDFGNVCATHDFHRFVVNCSVAAQIPELKVEEVLFACRTYSPLFEALECGEIGPTQFFHGFTRALGCAERIDYATFARLWVDVFDRENVELDQLLARLPHQKYLLSNINKIIYGRYVAYCTIVHNHFPTLERRVLSYKVGAIKPNPLIYKVALAQANVKAEEALFIDDMPENIASWRAIGGNGIVYHATKNSIQELEAELRAFGVLAP